MKLLMFTLVLLQSVSALAEAIPPTRYVSGHYVIHRSYYQPIPHKTGYTLVTEDVCGGDIQVPVYDFRSEQPDGKIEAGDNSCSSTWGATIITPSLGVWVTQRNDGTNGDTTDISAYLSFLATDYDAVSGLQQPVAHEIVFLGTQPITPLMSFLPTEQMGLECSGDGVCTPTGLKYQFSAELSVSYR